MMNKLSTNKKLIPEQSEKICLGCLKLNFKVLIYTSLKIFKEYLPNDK